MEKYLSPRVEIFWPNTKETFSREQFIHVNCDYPGDWEGKVLRVESVDTENDSAGIKRYVSVSRVWNDEASFHAVSFFEFLGGKIIRLEEFWGDDGEVPEWRK